MKRATTALVMLILAVSAGGCGLIGDVLVFSFWVGAIVVLLVGLAIWGLSRMLGGGRRRPPPPPPV